MPFAKRIVEPQLLVRHPIPNDEGLLFEDLCSITNVALSRTLRQLSDLSKHACSLFQELENEIVSTNQRVWALQNKIGKIQQTASALDPKMEAVRFRSISIAVSNLDIESKLTSHYQAPWHQQHNLFHTCTRPACLEELHRHAKLNLRALHRDQQQRQRSTSRERSRVTISISVAPPMPTFPSTHKLRRREQRGRHSRMERSVRESDVQTIQRKERPAKDSEFKPVLRKAGTNTETDGELQVMSHRPKCPVPNAPTTLDKQTNWSKALPLPTPEERIKNDSQVISSCIIPINVSGVGFDREASARCSLVHSQSVLQRRRKLRRRKTITGIPKRVQQDMDSDESPVARERTVIIHANPHKSHEWHEELSLSGRVLHTKDSGCQTDDFLITAPSRRRIRAQRGQGIPASLSHSTGNITSLPDRSDTVYAAASATRVRSRSLPREGGRLLDEDQDDSDDDDDEDDDEDDEEEDEELSPYEAEDFLPGPGQRIPKDEEESTDDQAMPELQFGSLKRMQHSESPDHTWIERGRSRLPRKVDMGSCEISSSSDTFSSPIHSASTTGVLGSQIDHKEDHQSSSGNWSGSSSTCPSQTSETLPPAASPPLTGSSHCDSELSLNTGSHVIDDNTGFIIDPYHIDKPQGQGQRSNSFTSSATDQMDDAGVSTASDGEWNCAQDQQDQSCTQDFSPKRSREDESGVSCPSYSSGETYESFSDQASARKSEMHYIVDTEGFYSSMHFDSGLKGSRSYYNYAAIDPDCGPSGNIAPGMTEYPQPEYRATRTLGRPCLSLRKPKAKPPPPKRSSSLKETSSDVNVPEQNEPKITCELPLPLSSREMKLQLDLADSAGHLETAGLESLGAWGVENVRDMLDCSSPFSSSDTHSFKDEGAVQADYADLWLHNDLKSNDPYRSLSNSSSATGTTVIECIKSPERSETHTCQPRSRPSSPTLPPPESEFKLASPEKLAGLASPSSGYSSQSETPTSSFPSAFFPGPLSPTSGKRKPKVPERKSSLCSLQQQQLSVRDPGISCRRETDFYAIPPSHLDLSALHSKHFPHRNQMHILHQNKQKAAIAAAAAAEARSAAAAAAEARSAAAAAAEARSAATAAAAAEACTAATASTKESATNTAPISAHLAITPTVLRSVQLRSICRPSDGNQGLDQDSSNLITRPKCPTIITDAPSSSNRHNRKPPAYKPPAAQVCDSQIPLVENIVFPQEEVRVRQERFGPGTYWAMTAFRTPVDPNCEKEVSLKRSSQCFQQEQDSRRCLDVQKTLSPERLKQDLNQLSRPDPSTQSMCLASTMPPPAYSEIQRSNFVLCNSPDKVPVSTQEASHSYTISDVQGREEDYETSGVATRSASQDIREEESTPDTEDYFSKDSTPSDNSSSPLTDDSRLDDDVFPSPNKLRTTEDLFAMIHRSKRKVLGRKDSGEVSGKGRPVVPPVTTPVSNPTVCPVIPAPPVPSNNSQRASGPIYRSAKKSSTSSEEFKLLLLKKGSRTDSSYRMSATEILKSPITPKTQAELLLEAMRQPEEIPLPQLDSTSSGDPLPSPFPKANSEGFSPKTLTMSAASRQGRSRIPPAANSSRYSTRSRLYTAPMQAISEGETENSDGSPHDDRSS
ncbi:actin remodeling regulator NHS isoform X6 [Danio rerio]|uniref:Actin remodeling regulator NHS isoform X6 n=2 Tax=Danio rerio TaxID=7955 RepID=A0A8M3AXP9_DANRE|nr:Nance-Horan syndrome protein isoform X5 [Danio rerio]|eukprot:XP_009304395.1 Nance-Horan syndrome protein isoform X5 [Danio rerio]